MNGIVMKSTGIWYRVRTDVGIFDCRLRGKLRLDESKETNPAAVGDAVAIETKNKQQFIAEILPRRNHLVRNSTKKTAHTHVLAANIDMLLLIATPKEPRTSLGFIDRVLTTAEAFEIPQWLVFNKSDLLTEKEREEVQALQELYEKTGVKTSLISAASENLSEVAAFLRDKTTLIAGHSGVGKSTLLNALVPVPIQEVGAVSNYSRKGMHTTTFVEMFELEAKTYIIDTPGIKEWSLEMTDQEVSDYFPEMRIRRNNCKFASRCLHINEPQCEILNAVESGEIALSRYESYLSIMRGEDNRK